MHTIENPAAAREGALSAAFMLPTSGQKSGRSATAVGSYARFQFCGFKCAYITHQAGWILQIYGSSVFSVAFLFVFLFFVVIVVIVLGEDFVFKSIGDLVEFVVVIDGDEN